MTLNQFRELIRENGKTFEVFRMDNSKKGGVPDMRKYVGLGSCNCCDYFFVSNNKVFVVEVTDPTGIISKIKRDVPYLKDDDKDDYVRKTIRQENYVKAYGSLLVLCRLTAQCNEAAQRIGNKKYDFWLVFSGSETDESKRFLDDIREPLSNQMKSVLRIVEGVEIIHNSQLSRVLAQQIHST